MANIVASLMDRAFLAHQAHKFVDAIALYEVVLAREPDNVDALNLCASAYRSNGDVKRAIALYQRALALAPQRPDILLNAGNALLAGGRGDDAIALYSQARRLDPENAEVLVNLGIAFAKVGDYTKAVEAYRATLAVKPDHRVAGHNLGNALAEIGAYAEASATLRRLIDADPDFIEARYNLSLDLLRLGDYATGFEEYEHRWATPGFPAKPNHVSIPAWNGRPFRGRRLLLHAEQGIGDTLQFLRFVAQAKSLGGEVVLQMPRALVRLCQTVAGVDRVVSDDRDIGEVDCQCPLLGLPHRLKLTLGAVGMPAPYLAAEPALVERWAGRLAFRPGQPTVGLVWRGNPKSPADRGRSLAGPADYAPFAGLDGVRLISLQKLGPDEIVRAETPSGWAVAAAPFVLEHPGPDFDNGFDGFVDSAAVMSRLDLVVSVCTAPLHLAGALGRPAIALLKAVPDWRWLTGRTDSPWYPSLTLCRQEMGETFAPVLLRASALARRLIAAGRN